MGIISWQWGVETTTKVGGIDGDLRQEVREIVATKVEATSGDQPSGA